MVAPKITTTQDAITTQKDCLARMLGDITPEAIDDLEEELGGILVKYKPHHFSQAQKSGHLGVILGEDQMQTIYGDPTYTYVVQVNQRPYDTTSYGSASAMLRSQAEAIHNYLNDTSLVYEGVCIGTTKLIIYVTGEDTVASLKRRYIGFGNMTPQQMLHHLRTNMCIKVNIKEKEAFKTQGYTWEWDTSKNIITYFKEIKNFKEKLDSRGITACTAETATAAVTRMYDSSYFSEEKMIR